jgi:hypothetical protein
MKVLIVLSMFFFGVTAYANPEVKKNTDIDKRKAESHSQVTRCEGGGCTLNSVTRFNNGYNPKSRPGGKTTYFGECNFSEEGGKRYEHCKLTKKKKKAKVKTVVKEKIVDTTKNNRIQLHVGYGSDGLEVDESHNETTVKEKRKAILGLQYTRRLNQDFNVGISAFTNKSVTATFGIDY